MRQTPETQAAGDDIAAVVVAVLAKMKEDGVISPAGQPPSSGEVATEDKDADK